MIIGSTIQYYIYLVGGLEHSLVFHIQEMVTPTDELLTNQIQPVEWTDTPLLGKDLHGVKGRCPHKDLWLLCYHLVI